MCPTVILILVNGLDVVIHFTVKIKLKDERFLFKISRNVTKHE